jgi:hypothetical protein
VSKARHPRLGVGVLVARTRADRFGVSRSWRLKSHERRLLTTNLALLITCCSCCVIHGAPSGSGFLFRARITSRRSLSAACPATTAAL